MGRQIAVSNEIFERLKALAEPFVDKEPQDVIRRLLENEEARRHTKPLSQSKTTVDGVSVVSVGRPHSWSSPRAPRERGAEVQIENIKLNAVSVRDLYDQALRFFVKHHRSELEKLLPFKTSIERYLIARKPVHPTGNTFVVPVEFEGFYMEAHKDYKNAIAHLSSLTMRLGLRLAYVGKSF